METRAHFLVIGSVVLMLVLSAFGFVVWLTRADVDHKTVRYRIYFDGPVSGLTKGSSVRLNGVPVGVVKRIRIPREDPSKVLVEADIGADVPITKGAVARLEILGFTGAAFVQIRGAPTGEPLTAGPNGEPPVIPSERSPIQQVFEEAPDLINEAILAINAVRQLLNEENRQHVTRTLAHLESLAAALDEQKDDIAATIADTRATIQALRETADSITRTADSLNRLVDEKGAAAVGEAREAFAALRDFSRTLQSLIARNEPAIDRFTGDTLPEIGGLVADLRRATRSLDRLLRRLEENPAQIIYGRPRPEYVPPSRGNRNE
ncbi:MAG: MCE family protein [Alphaproteobacteria bacterium]|nr:MAG: MCE family protein [Alphaproteobacteria bacterium]